MIEAKKLTFAYEGGFDNIFEDVSFCIDTDWKLGLTGRNGRGKTTLLKLLEGRYPYGGSITASVDFEYFPYEVSDPEALAENVIAGILGDYQNWELVRELSLLGLMEEALHRPFRTLSNGEKTKLLLAALFLRENAFLLIDEPTNHLDIEGRETVSRYLNSKKGFILVSHDRTFLDGCVDHMMSINKTDIEIQKGNFSSWQRNKERQDSFELAKNEVLKKDIRRLETAAKRSADWADKVEKTKFGTRNSGLKPDRGYIGSKSARMMKRSKTIENRRGEEIGEKAKLLGNIEDCGELKLFPLGYFTDRLLSLDEVSICYGGRAVCRGLSFEIVRGDRIALRGKNGSGKSSILKLICGENIEHTGKLQTGSRLILSYVPQDTSFLRGSLSDYALKSGIDESLFKAMLRKLDFSRAQFEKDMSDFSEGQKKKTLIARSLCERAHLYVWDEPLNFVDVVSRIQIEKLLSECGATMLFVEHDAEFCRKTATKTVELQALPSGAQACR